MLNKHITTRIKLGTNCRVLSSKLTLCTVRFIKSTVNMGQYLYLAFLSLEAIAHSIPPPREHGASTQRFLVVGYVLYSLHVCVWERQIWQLRLMIPSTRALFVPCASGTFLGGSQGGDRYASPWLHTVFGNGW
jgi:hypothetical protein